MNKVTLEEDTFHLVSHLQRTSPTHHCIDWGEHRELTQPLCRLTGLLDDPLLVYHSQMRTEEEFRSRTWRILHGEEIRLHLFLFEMKTAKDYSGLVKSWIISNFRISKSRIKPKASFKFSFLSCNLPFPPSLQRRIALQAWLLCRSLESTICQPLYNNIG